MLACEPPNDHPKDSPDLVKGKLLPSQITCPSLKAAVARLHKNWRNSNWTGKAVTARLGTHCINGKCIDQFFKHEHCMLSKMMSESPEVQKLVQERELTHPKLFQDCPVSPMWERDFDSKWHVNVAMHMVFWGIIKCIMFQLQNWCSLKAEKQNFCFLLEDPQQFLHP